MARVKLSEFRAKSILIPDYRGFSLTFDGLAEQIEAIPSGNYVLKVDQGIKKRGKQGLVAVNITTDQVAEYATEWNKKGFTRYILEPLHPHTDEEEKYLSISRNRDGLVINYSDFGGVDVEDNADKIQEFSADDLEAFETATAIPASFAGGLIEAMNTSHMSFLEINPLVVQNGALTLLDAAILVDSAGEYFVDTWSEDDVVEAGRKTDAELAVKEMDDNSPAALKLTVLNEDAALWLLLSGGGASITIADTVEAAGYGKELGNYGEYSGGPSTAETYLYTKEILKLVLNSKAPKKAIVIAGGVANFTDVAKTFKGIIQALDEVADELTAQNTKVYVRRGGPNEKEGLKLMEDFLKKRDLHGSVYGSDVVLTEAVSDALEYIGGSHA